MKLENSNTNILIFAGTTEGRKLVEAVANSMPKGYRYYVCVATEYGKQILPKENEQLEILSERFSMDEMKDLMKIERINLVIDATHPYAIEVSKNIQHACKDTGIKYTRFVRGRSSVNAPDAVVVKDISEAIDFLKETEGNVLLGTGSKDLERFTQIDNYQKRIYPRILPTPEAVKSAYELGFDAGHLICMQGPFSYESNVALLAEKKISYFVTKESGEIGGYEEKVNAASAVGATLIVVARPKEIETSSSEEVYALCGISIGQDAPADWFPFYYNICGKKILIVGGGTIASRRIRTLLKFSCRIKVVALEIDEWILEEEKKGTLIACEKNYDYSDLFDAEIVLAATNDPALNTQIGKQCKERFLPVNIATNKEECDFYFPAIVKEGDLVVGITACGKNHELAKEAKQRIEMELKGKVR